MEPGSDTEDSQSDGEEGERERGRDPERMVEEGDGGVGIQGSPGRTQVNLGRMESFADTLYCPSEPIGSLDRHKIKEMEEKCMRHITGLAAQQGREVAVIYLRRDDGSNDIKVVSQSLRLRMTMGKAIESGSIDCAEEGQQKMLSQNRGKLPNEVLRDIIKHSCTQMRFSSTATVSDIYLSARDDPSMTTVFNSVEWDHIRKPISHKDVHDKRDQLLLRARIHFLRGDCPYTWEKTLLTGPPGRLSTEERDWSAPSDEEICKTAFFTSNLEGEASYGGLMRHPDYKSHPNSKRAAAGNGKRARQESGKFGASSGGGNGGNGGDVNYERDVGLGGGGKGGRGGNTGRLRRDPWPSGHGRGGAGGAGATAHTGDGGRGGGRANGSDGGNGGRGGNFGAPAAVAGGGDGGDARTGPGGNGGRGAVANTGAGGDGGDVVNHHVGASTVNFYFCIVL